MPRITELIDEPTKSVRTVAERRASQKQGSQGRGLPENKMPLNECQGHKVDILEDSEKE